MLKILKTFYGFLAKKRLVFGLFLLLVILSSATGAIQPYFYKLFVDAIPNSNFDALLNILILFIGVRLLTTIFEVIGRTVGDIVMINAASSADIKVFKHLHKLDFAFHTTKSSGVLINRIKRGVSALWGLHEVLNFKVLEFLVNIAVMFFFFRNLDPRIIILAVITMALSLAAARIFIPHNIKTRKGFNKAIDRITGIIVDNMINYDTVKMFSKENWETKRLKRKYIDWKKYLWKYGLSFRYIGASVNSILNIGLFLILYLILHYSS